MPVSKVLLHKNLKQACAVSDDGSVSYYELGQVGNSFKKERKDIGKLANALRDLINQNTTNTSIAGKSFAGEGTIIKRDMSDTDFIRYKLGRDKSLTAKPFTKDGHDKFKVSLDHGHTYERRYGVTMLAESLDFAVVAGIPIKADKPIPNADDHLMQPLDKMAQAANRALVRAEENGDLSTDQLQVDLGKIADAPENKGWRQVLKEFAKKILDAVIRVFKYMKSGMTQEDAIHKENGPEAESPNVGLHQ